MNAPRLRHVSALTIDVLPVDDHAEVAGGPVDIYAHDTAPILRQFAWRD